MSLVAPCGTMWHLCFGSQAPTADFPATKESSKALGFQAFALAGSRAKVAIETAKTQLKHVEVHGVHVGCVLLCSCVFLVLSIQLSLLTLKAPGFVS